MAQTRIRDAQAVQSVDLTSEVTNTLPVANGGTGGTSQTLNNVLLGNGTGAFQNVAPSTAGKVLRSNGTTWTSTALTEADITNLTTDLAAKATRLIPTATKTGNYTASADELVICDNTTTGFTITLPTAPANGTRVGVKTNSALNTVTVASGGTDVFNQAGGSTTQSLNMQNQVSSFDYYSGVWIQISQAIAVGQMDLRYLRADSTAQTITGKSIDLASNTVTMTLAQLNTAVSNAEIVQGSVNGTGTSLTLWTGTQAQYNALGAGRPSTTVYIVTP